MTDLQLKRRIKSYLTLVNPQTEVTNLTVAGVEPQKITLSAAPTNTSVSNWVGGVVKFTNGPMNNTFAVIAAVNGAVLTLSAPMDPAERPVIGNTVTLSCGVLGNTTKTRIYDIEPNSVQEANDAGFENYVFINTPAMLLSTKGIGRNNTDNAIINQNRAFDIQIMCETPLITGQTTAALAYYAQTTINMLAEQVITRLHWFKMVGGMGQEEPEPIETEFFTVDIDGGGKANLAAINFSIILHR